MKKLRIAIDFRVQDPRQGVGTAVLALAHGLSNLKSIDQEYFFIVLEQNTEFFRPYISGPCSLVSVPNRQKSLVGNLKAVAKRFPFVSKIWLALHSKDSILPSSDGTAEKLGCDLIHFPAQTAYKSNLPTIYQPWDLQHCHYPQFFTEEELQFRAAYYQGFCRLATFVCVQTEWTKQDVVEQFGISPEKVVVIRWGTAFEAYTPLSQSKLDSIGHHLNLPAEFLLYPAVTWPHKNHELILRALALLRKATGRTVQIMFTGASTEYREHLDAIAKDLGVSDQVRYLGFVNNSQIQALFRLAVALVFPSRFEGLGLPVLEAFRVGLPVICSSATVLPEVTAGAAKLFDPDSPEQLAEAIEQLLSKPELQEDLKEKGREVLSSYTADTTAMNFRELYAATVARYSKEASTSAH